MSYWDTSALVKLYVKETDSAVFEQHLLEVTDPILETPSPPAISRIGIYEAQAVFHKKESDGVLLAGGAQTLCLRMTKDIADGKLKVVEAGSDFELEYNQILKSCYQHAPVIPIRTLDAIHLTAARVASESEIVATDKRLRDAAKMLGFSLYPA